MIVAGIIVEGHRVASGSSTDYPYGTIEKQMPFFKELGLDLTRFYPGTLNVSIAPRRFALLRPEYTFRQVAWTELHPPEDFSFSPCKIRFIGRKYAGYIYYPHPETKIRHFQNPSLIEVIAEHIPNMAYGDQVELEVNSQEIRLIE
jgi:hypothetical protein